MFKQNQPTTKNKVLTWSRDLTGAIQSFNNGDVVGVRLRASEDARPYHFAFFVCFVVKKLTANH